MQQLEYSIGAILDGIGRVAVCSEFMAVHSISTRYSLSVERFIWEKEDPEKVLMEQMQSQLGIEEEALNWIDTVASSTVEHGVVGMPARKVHLYVFEFNKPLTMNIFNPRKSPIDFYDVDQVTQVFSSSLMNLSFCGERMLTFLNSNKFQVLKRHGA